MLRRGDRRGVERGAQALGGGLHERRVEGAGDVEAPGAGAGLVARHVLGLVERVDGAAEHELAGGVVVGDHEAQARGERAHVCGRRRRASRSCRRRCRSPASAMAAARSSTSRTASSNCSAPAATRAAYSPSEWPAAARASASSVGVLAPLVPGGDRAQEERGLLVARALGQALEGVIAEQLEAALEQRVPR